MSIVKDTITDAVIYNGYQYYNTKFVNVESGLYGGSLGLARSIVSKYLEPIIKSIVPVDNYLVIKGLSDVVIYTGTQMLIQKFYYNQPINITNDLVKSAVLIGGNMGLELVMPEGKRLTKSKN